MNKFGKVRYVTIYEFEVFEFRAEKALSLRGGETGRRAALARCGGISAVAISEYKGEKETHCKIGMESELIYLYETSRRKYPTQGR